MIAIDLAMYLAIAEAILEVDAQALRRVARIGEAESALAAPFAGFGDVEFYEGLATKAAILCSRLVRNHPLPDGNKRAAYVSMLMFIDLNGGTWRPRSEDERVETIESLAAGTLPEDEFVQWVRAHVSE
jgi:death on curing protein